MSSITAANSVIILSVPGVFAVGQRLAGFATDNVFDTDPIDTAQVQMGVDGRLSAGFIFVPIAQNYHLQADSPSNAVFDQWYSAQQQARELFPANAIVNLASAIGKKWTMTRGFLTGFPPTPAAAKVLQPRKFTITWNLALPSPA
jgi:tail fiber protein gp32